MDQFSPVLKIFIILTLAQNDNERRRSLENIKVRYLISKIDVLFLQLLDGADFHRLSEPVISGDE